MKKYSVEGGIDFFTELYKSLDDEESNHKTEEDNNKCLINNQLLTDKFIEMSCGHKFNYLPLYYDILNHKNKFNVLEGSATRLKRNEIRCPYCRKRQTGLLPYYEDLNLPKTCGVNFIEHNYDPDTDFVPSSNQYKKCEYLSPNICFNVCSQNISEVYNDNLVLEDCKFLKCKFMGTQINYGNTGGNYGDDKFYCWTHKKLVVNAYKKAQLNKIKEENKQLKLKEKEELKKAKDEAKQKEKEELKKTKVALKKKKLNIDENIIIGVSSVAESVATVSVATVSVATVSDLEGELAKGVSNTKEKENQVLLCQEILKSGTNKGSLCGNKIFENNVCKRHLNKIITLPETVKPTKFIKYYYNNLVIN